MNLSERLAQRQASPDGLVRPAPASVAGRPVGHTDPFAGVKRSLHQALLAALGPTLYDAHMDEADLEARVRQTLQTVLQQDDTPLTAFDRNRIAREVADEILGHGPLEPYLRDPEVSEVMVNGADDCYVERKGRLEKVESGLFEGEEAVL
ncbi:MAG TPA: hypothetical protein VEL73_07345, partial [Mycobacteriales bacterium]|nr:hypothetical protein [Mycobacteriales bacterium]